MEKEKRIKRKIKIKWIPLLIASIVATISYFVYIFVTDLPITNIYIKGNKILKDQEIIELAKIGNYPSFLQTTGHSIENKIKKSPYIQKVSVKRKMWGQIIITVEEEKPVFINTEGKLVLSSKKEIENDRDIVVASLINYTPDTKYEELIKQLDRMNNGIREKISEIKYEPTDQDKDRFALLMNDGNLVYVTLTKFNKIDYYNTIISDFPCQRGILNLDSGNHFEIKENHC